MFDPQGLEDLLEEGMVTHSNILAWKIPWTEAHGGYSPWNLWNHLWNQSI